jgi:hypothetical protein
MGRAANLHRLAGTQDRLRREAMAGQCALHPGRPAVAVIEGTMFRPKGACGDCARFGEDHGYTVHRDLED